MNNRYLYVLDNTNNLWRISIDDVGDLHAIQVPLGTAPVSLVTSFNVPRQYGQSFQITVSGGLVTSDTIAFSVLYPTILELDSPNFEWTLTAEYDSVNNAWTLAAQKIGPSGMKKGDIVKAVYGDTNDNNQLAIWLTWLDVDIAQIVHRKRYWWRKKIADFITFPNVPDYNLVGYGIARDFEQAVSVCWAIPTHNGLGAKPLGYIEEDIEIQSVRQGTVTGPPEAYYITPGKTQSLSIDPIPNAQYPLALQYWSGYNPRPIDKSKIHLISDEVVPIIPPPFHHVALLALQRRSFLMLYGKADSRYKAIEQELFGPDGQSGALGDLDRIVHPSIQAVENFLTHDPSVRIRSDRL